MGWQSLEYHDGDYREGQNREPERRQSLQVRSQWRLAAAKERMGVGNTEFGVQTLRTDAGSNDGSSSLNTTTFVFTGGILDGQQAQSVAQDVVSTL